MATSTRIVPVLAILGLSTGLVPVVNPQQVTKGTRAAVPPVGFVHRELLALHGRSAGDNFGVAVAGLGDVDGDSLADLAVGAWLDDEVAPAGGRVSVYSGGTGAEILHLVLGTAGDRFGFAVDGVGDVNGDGHDDLVAGAPDDDPIGFQSGSVLVISGLHAAILLRIEGDGPEQQLGYAVAGIGDADGDGIGDFAVSGDETDSFTPGRGFARLYGGASGALLQSFVGPSLNSGFGEALDAAGDVDKDGRADWIVGAPGDDSAGINAGSATVYSGRDGTIIHRVFGTRPFGFFGNTVSTAGDLNFDKHAEFMVGALNAGGGPGSVRVFDGLDGTLLFELFGDDPDDEFGRALARAGDLDLDGRDDLFVGSACDLELLCGRSGYVRAYSGLDGRLLGAVGGAPNGQFGFALDSMGDLDGDGIPELLVGAFRDTTAGNDAGAAFVFSGSPLNRR